MARHPIRRILLISFASVFFLFVLAVGIAFERFALGSPGPGDKTGTLEIGGRTRTYFVHVSTGYDGLKPLPLVFVLHGGGQSPESAERMSGMSTKADIENFLVVYPSGTGRFSRMPTWNSGNCCGYALKNNVDDVAFLRALLGKLEKDYTVDSRRIYATGISNGGMMSYRVACELADQFAAVAPVEGAQNVECKPSAPVSVIIFHGTADRLVAFDGGETTHQIGPPRTDNSVANAISFWVKEDACAEAPNHEVRGVLKIDTYTGCKSGTGVALYAIDGGRHTWPGTTISGNKVAATDLIWSFFAMHPKP
ncbi:MAG: PHB depolymerase family esterase [Candidatus Acidiferrales bacterium]